MSEFLQVKNDLTKTKIYTNEETHFIEKLWY